jgi:hypothetical protein
VQGLALLTIALFLHSLTDSTSLPTCPFPPLIHTHQDLERALLEYAGGVFILADTSSPCPGQADLQTIMTALAVGEYLQHRRLALERQLAWMGQRLLNRILLRPVRGFLQSTANGWGAAATTWCCDTMSTSIPFHHQHMCMGTCMWARLHIAGRA